MTPSNSPSCSLRWLHTSGLGLLLLGGLVRAAAQDAVMTVPQEPVTAPLLRSTEAPAQSAPIWSSLPLFQLGQISLHPHVLYRYLNAEGLPVAGRRVASEIQTFAPGLTLDIGTHWSLDYSPSWTWYTARALNDSVSQSVRLSGAGAAGDWGLQFAENFGTSSTILAETARQTRQRTWLTSLGATRSFGAIMGVELNASLNENYNDIAPDTRNWSTQDWLTLRFSPRFDVGFGPGAGYVDIVHAPDMTYERYMGRLNWRPTDKLTVGLNGGMEYRHSRASDGMNLRNPLLTASLAYQPFTTTHLDFAYSRSVSSSYFRDQVTKSSDFHASIDQRLLGHFYLHTGWSRRKSDYAAVTTTIVLTPATDSSEGTESQTYVFSTPGRSDRVDMFNARLSVQFLQRFSLAATFQRSQNHSSESGFSFSSKQYGIELSCKY